ncbi:ABC-type transport auxiliary lipoprotein family protein [Oryzibacter oryziterrae]|uniref:ABC-type transport auxiliary lipoprotein family protein n=1 Tax=Oryzibacter oryziterrae TaxID=2766474 RepID=UPI001F372721|nr:ABC-type transport auxiliary lipoprotein family protein [Oryzibacter oryziterrae]
MTFRWIRLGVLGLAGLALAGLSGCSTLSGGGAAPSIFDLDAPTDFGGLKGKAAVQLLVPKPSVSDALASSRVAVRQGGAEIAYFPGVTWSDEVPSLIQTTLTRAFENSGAVKAVGRPGESLAIDDQVIVDVRAFELDVSQAPVGHVVLGVKLLDDRNGKVRATKVFDVSVPATTDAAKPAIAALNKASEEAVRQVVAWTVEVL